MALGHRQRCAAIITIHLLPIPQPVGLLPVQTSVDLLIAVKENEAYSNESQDKSPRRTSIFT
jgi:hypothetical protein